MSPLQNFENQTVEELRNELVLTKSSNAEKFEKLDLQMRKLKQDNRILEKFLRIEMRSAQDILDEFRAGIISERQLLSGYQTDKDGSLSPRHYSRAVSRFTLDFENNIY